MTLLIINGNIPCCDCKRDTGIRSDATHLFDESEVYCYSCSAAMLSELEDELDPITVRAPPPYPDNFLAPVLGRSGVGISISISDWSRRFAETPVTFVEAPKRYPECYPEDCVCGECPL